MEEKRCPIAIDTRNEYRITESTGNVFTDLGFDDAEAQVLALRADLMALLAKQIKARRMTQVAAAKVLGVSQGRVSDLTRGKADKFSLDMLVTFAAKMGKPARLELAACGPPSRQHYWPARNLQQRTALPHRANHRTRDRPSIAKGKCVSRREQP